MSSAVMPIVRVAILADSRLTEIALPAELPLREILPAVERLVVPAVQDGEAMEPTMGRPRPPGSALPRSAGRRSASTPVWTLSASSTVICWRCSRSRPGRPRLASSRTSPTRR